MLIILYGEISNKSKWKHQRMIDGGATCGYREYARKFGHIVYVTPQKVKLPWEHSIIEPKNILKFISKYPDAVIWSVKTGKRKESEVLSKIKNKKVYYSCNASNRNSKHSHINLIDTPGRIKRPNKDMLWMKGKDPDYWKPIHDHSEFDYLLIGTRGDKNEVFFLKQLNSVKGKRRILWIGGQKHSHKVKTNHEVVYTKFVGQDNVRNNISRGKVGILFTELKIEGFPQSFLEMTMCGVPVVYNKRGPRNAFYFHDDNCRMSLKKNLVENAEYLLKNRNPKACRKIAIENYSIEKSYQRILKCLK